MNLDVLDGLHNILFLRDVRWLQQRCEEGRQITDLCNPFFLELVEPDEPVIIKRAHFEEIDPNDQRLVVLGLFKPRHGGIPLLNEIVCHPQDFLRVIKQVRIDPADVPSDEQVAAWKEQRNDLEFAHEVEGTPWEEDEMEWAILLEAP